MFETNKIQVLLYHIETRDKSTKVGVFCDMRMKTVVIGEMNVIPVPYL